MAVLHERDLRGQTKIGWLDSAHTFSFGGFRDPNRMGHRALRVINDDRVIPGAGFGTHSHRDMDILTYVVSGELGHKDSLGNGSTITPGEIQMMSAGTGITHSEMNVSETDPVHFLQIWMIPDENGLTPSYDQKRINSQAPKNRLHPIATPTGTEDGVKLNSDSYLYTGHLDAGTSVSHAFKSGRAGFLQVVSGVVSVSGEELRAGDGLQFEGVESCDMTASEDSVILLFDLA